MPNEISHDPRIDPRIRAMFGEFDIPAGADVASREELLAEANTPEAHAVHEAMKQLFDSCDNEEVAPSTGLSIKDYDFVSQPDGNRARIQFIRPDSGSRLPCVYYIHGGGMQSLSCYYGNYRAWGKIIAARGVAVAMVDFRNALLPSSLPEVASMGPGAALRWCPRTSSVSWTSRARLRMPSTAPIF